MEQVLAANEGFAAQHQVKLVLRAGRLGTGQARALADLGPRFLIATVPFLLLPLAGWLDGQRRSSWLVVTPLALLGAMAPPLWDLAAGAMQALTHGLAVLAEWRWAVLHRARTPEQLKAFNAEGYRYVPAASDADRLVLTLRTAADRAEARLIGIALGIEALIGQGHALLGAPDLS